jgi:hypothetical protein
VFGLFAAADRASRATDVLASRHGWRAWLTRTTAE